MKSPLLVVSGILLVAHAGPRVLAADDPFVIELSVRPGTEQQATRGRSSSAAAAASAARPVLTVKTGTRLHIRWAVVHQEKTANIRDVTVHAFLDKENAIGQSSVPKPGPDVIYESALVMDFAAQGKSTADFLVYAPSPGIYLLRVETIGAAKTAGDEFFAAIDMKVIP